MAHKHRCLGCHWCLAGPGEDGGPQFYCEYKAKPLTTAMVWRKACKDYLPIVEAPRSSPVSEHER